MKDYILFIPPEEISEIKPRAWNAREARIYFDWFISVKDDRVEYLLTSINEVLSEDAEQDLKRIGKKVTDLLFVEPFSQKENNIFIISNKGLAIVTDLSILISQLIINTYPKIAWKILKRPKRDISYNLPALFDFPTIKYLELIGAGITNAKAILRNEKTSNIWFEMYQYALKLLKNS